MFYGVLFCLWNWSDCIFLTLLHAINQKRKVYRGVEKGRENSKLYIQSCLKMNTKEGILHCYYY